MYIYVYICTVEERKGAHERAVAAVGERRDDEAGLVPLILKSIVTGAVYHTYLDL